MTESTVPRNARHSGEFWAAPEPKHRRNDAPVDALPGEPESTDQSSADSAASANPYDREFDLSEFGENPDTEVAG